MYSLLPEIRDQVEKKLLTYALAARKVVLPKATIERGSIVAGRYYSDKLSNTFLLPIRWNGVTSCTSTDTTITIHSCSSQNNQLAISVTKK